MGFLLDAVTQKKFEVQRATVKNERGQNYDNRPYGMMWEKVGEALFPEGHPYSWPTIGYIEDLNRVDVNDLKKFFMRWYGPNNAVLTVAGDVNPAQVIAMVEKYFGPIPKGPEVKNLPKTPVTLDKDRYMSYEDKVVYPMIQFNIPTVPSYHPDEAPLDFLANILSGTKNSIFYQKFTKTNIAVEAYTFNLTAELSGRFLIGVKIDPKATTLQKADSIIRASLVEFEKKGVTDDDLKKYKVSIEKDVYSSLESVSGKASSLAAYQTFTGNPNYLKKDLARYANVTKADVMRVYNTYIKNKPAVILSVYPKGKPEMKAKEDNYVFKKPDVTNVKESDEYKNLVYNKAKDNFDRSKKPTPGPNPVVKVPDFWKEKFANGLNLIGSKSDEVPTVTLQLNIEAGHRFEPKDKAGVAQITADLLNESTQKHTAEEISELLDNMGSSISVGAGQNEISMTISCLKKNLDATLKIAEEILFLPKFDAADFERSKKQQLQSIANQVTQATTIASNVYTKLLYGDGVMGLPTLGTKETVESITLDDVKAYYANNFSPVISQLIAVGDITKEELFPKITFLKSWPAKVVTRFPESLLSKPDKTKIFLVDKTSAPQSEVRIGYMCMPYDATGEYFKATVMNYVLGGAFNSRMNLNLREDKGWTYGAGARFNGSKYTGPFTAYGGIKGEATDSSIVEFVQEMKTYIDSGITDAELKFTKSSIGQSDALKYETPGQKAGFLKRILDYNLDKNFVETQTQILNSMTVADVNALAKKYLPIDQMYIMVVGDKAKIYDGLKKLGYEIVELDMSGNVIPVPKEEIKPPYNYEMKKDNPPPVDDGKKKKKKK